MPRDEEDQTDEVAQNDMNGDGITLEWRPEEWSKCSQTCGNGGKKYRKVRCTVSRKEHYNDGSSAMSMENIPDSICLDAAVEKPETEAPCESGPCPKWFASEWSDCNQSKCVSRKTGVLHREVSCGLNEGDPMEERFCEAVLKPRASKTCRNKQCKGTWKASQWSECQGECGQVGEKGRDVTCYWKGTTQPAGDACKKRRKPRTVTKCRVTNCSRNNEAKQSTTFAPITDIIHPNSVLTSVCIDRTKYCGLVQHFQLCHKEKYQIQCCQSCS